MSGWLLIAAGGATGSVLRYALQASLQGAVRGSFPWGTLAVNALGCLILGVLTGAFGALTSLKEEHRLGLTVGLLGGFTTFSAYALETQRLLQAQEWKQAALYVALSNGLGVAAILLGLLIVHGIHPK